MKLVSLAYDVDSPLPLSKKRDTPSPTSPSPPSQLVPNFISYVAYAVFPSTTIFGPFVTYSEHVKYTRRVAIVRKRERDTCTYLHVHVSMYMYMCISTLYVYV